MRVIKTYVGVDVPKDTLDIGTSPRSKARNFGNNEAGINRAITYLKKLAPNLIVM